MSISAKRDTLTTSWPDLIRPSRLGGHNASLSEMPATSAGMTTRNSKDTDPRAQKEAAEFEAHQRAYDALKRRRCTDWLFWELCAYKPCRRHRGCAGDVTRCFDRFWPLVAPATAERRAPHPPR